MPSNFEDLIKDHNKTCSQCSNCRRCLCLYCITMSSRALYRKVYVINGVKLCFNCWFPDSCPILWTQQQDQEPVQ